MDRIITGKGMKKVDEYTIKKIGIPSLVLMEQAAKAMFSFFEENAKKEDRILCICGTGNNGADGMALARQLSIKGYSADVVVLGDEGKATKEYSMQKNIAINCNVSISYFEDIKKVNVTRGIVKPYNNVWEKVLGQYDYIVDAIFGIGLTRDIEGEIYELINSINQINERKNKKITIISADIPSGLNADNGKIMGCAIKADFTITFGAIKSGLILYKGRNVSGKIIVADIGFPENSYKYGADKSELFNMITDNDIATAKLRLPHSNKGTYGKVLIIAGSKDTYGAAYLSAMAAFRAGCGLVRIVTHVNNRDLLYKMVPEAMIKVYSDDEPITEKELEEAVKWSNVVAMGPGMGADDKAFDIVKSVMKITKNIKKTMVIDADGLNIIAEHKELSKMYHEKVIITPHIGEASRLMEVSSYDIAENIVNYGKKYTINNNITMVLKDSTTIILGIESLDDKCDNKVCINMSGNAGMATAGSGDVLTGIIAGVLSGGLSVNMFEGINDTEHWKIYYACAMAVYIHGKAGDMASEKYGQTSMTASDILNEIGDIIS